MHVYHNTSIRSASCRIAKGMPDLPMKTKTTVHWAVSPVSHSYIFKSFQSACCMALCWQVKLEHVRMWVWNLHSFACCWESLPHLIAAGVSILSSVNVCHYLFQTSASCLLCCYTLACEGTMATTHRIFTQNIICGILVYWSCLGGCQPGTLFCMLFWPLCAVSASCCKVGPFLPECLICSSSVCRAAATGPLCTLFLSSVQDGICVLGKDHIYIFILCTPPHLSFISFPNIAFETVPVFVGLVMALSHPFRFKEDCLACPLSLPLSSRQSVEWCL